MPIVLGGDHSLAAGSVAATADWARRASAADRPDLGRRARRHEYAGDVAERQRARHAARRAARPGAGGASRIGGFSPKVLPEHTVLIGVRNLDEREKELVRESRRPCLHDEGHRSPGHCGGRRTGAGDLPATGTAGIHVSFDLDVCDPAIAPGVGTPVKGGLNYREAHLLMEIIADSSRLVALDLVEVNPTLDCAMPPRNSAPSWRCQRSARKFCSC